MRRLAISLFLSKKALACECRRGSDGLKIKYLTNIKEALSRGKVPLFVIIIDLDVFCRLGLFFLQF